MYKMKPSLAISPREGSHPNHGTVMFSMSTKPTQQCLLRRTFAIHDNTSFNVLKPVKVRLTNVDVVVVVERIKFGVVDNHDWLHHSCNGFYFYH